MADNVTITCRSFPEHPEDCDTINIIRRVFGAISCISCVFVIFVIWVFGRHSNFSQRLILFLCLAALLNGVGRIFQDSTAEQGSWCRFQAFWLTYFNYTVMMWVICITVNLFLNVINGIVTKPYEKWYHVVSWLLSLAVSLLPFFGDHYGPSGSWCWIVRDAGWQMGIWYGPLFFVIFVLICMYCFIIFTIYRKASTWSGTYDPETRQGQAMLKEDIKPLRLYPFVFLLLSLFPLINRIHNVVHDGSHVFGLVLMHTMTASIQGAAYSLVFAIDRDTIRSLTPAQIKVAILKKWAPPAVVQEYPATVITAEGGVEGPAATDLSTGEETPSINA